jgi:hypothetical protein
MITFRFTKFLLIVFLSCLASWAMAQVSEVKYKLSYNIQDNTHDLYLVIAKGSASTPIQRTQFNAQVSIVVNAGIDIAVVKNYMPLTNNTQYGGTVPCRWESWSNYFFQGKQYLSFGPVLSPTSQYNNLKEGDEVKLFSITLSKVACNNEVRLFDNEIDPSPGSLGGGDFDNGFTMGGIYPLYTGNENTSITECPSECRIFSYTDLNKDGKYNDGEPPLYNVKYELPSIDRVQLSDEAGITTFVYKPGSYTLSASPGFGTWVVGQKDLQIDIKEYTTFDTIGFAPVISKPKAKVNIDSWWFRCNENAQLNASVRNIESTELRGKLSVEIDPRVEIKKMEPAPILVNGNIYTWATDNIAIGAAFRPIIEVVVPPATSNEDFLTFQAFFTEDTDGVLDTYKYSERIRCSYDPNDKRVWPDRNGEDNLTLKDETLRYSIRFQNNGNDTAFAVTIVDVLDQRLDRSSLRVLGASHSVKTVMSHDTAFFIFKPIILPDSATDYRASQGYVSFEIKTLADIPEASIIRNTASIIFDRNAPIITNTVESTIVTELPCPSDAIWQLDGLISVNDAAGTYKWYNCLTQELVATTQVPQFTAPMSGSYYCVIEGDYCTKETQCISFLSSTDDIRSTVQIYPNPVTDRLSIKAAYKIEEIKLIDVRGQIIYRTQLDNPDYTYNCDLKSIIAGSYMLQIVGGGQQQYSRVVVIK